VKKSTPDIVQETKQPDVVTDTMKDILNNHSSFNKSLQGVKIFDKPVLAYVTPWNNHGYDVAKWFGAKLDLVSPVWLQIRRLGNAEFQITGDHDID
jgi:chitinase domain-containing protein 1